MSDDLHDPADDLNDPADGFADDFGDELEPPKPSAPGLPPHASRGLRLGGAIIDGIFGMIVMLPLMIWLGVFDGMFDAMKNPGAEPQGMEFDLQQTLMLFVLGWAAFFVLHGYLLFKNGQTIGKKLVGTRIVDEQGNVPAFGKLIVMRYLIIGALSNIPVLGGLLGLVNVLMIFRENHRCLHDDLAKTYVIRA